MPTLFPTQLDNVVDEVDIIEAAHLNTLQAKVGIDGSADTSSLDYLLKNTASTDPGHKHSISTVTGLQSALDGKVTANTGITGATKTKITYDSKGLVTAGADATTSDIAEGTNLYYTAARFNTAFASKTTSDLAEGTNLYYTATRFNTAFAAKSTSDLAEGSNLYFTTGRAITALTGQNISIFVNDSGYITGNQTITLSGDVTGSGSTSITTTLATVNSNTGAFGSATQAPVFTVNAKGLITAATNATITPAVGSITGLGTGVATALGVNVGSAGAFVTFNGALGTPSSGVLTNATGYKLSSIVAASGTNTIDNTNALQEWQWNTLAGGTGLKISSTSTAATGNTQKLFEVNLSGANANASQTTYAGYLTNTHTTGGSSFNVGLFVEASGANGGLPDNNIALIAKTANNITLQLARPTYVNAGFADAVTNGMATMFSRTSDGAYVSLVGTYNTSADAKTNLGISSRNDIAFASNGTEWMRMLTGGFFGIGTSAPTARLQVSQQVSTSGSPTALLIVGGAHTTLTASTESIGANFNFSATKQFATGALTTQREVLFQAPTYRFVGSSTLTTAATVAITGAPVKGTNTTLTNTHALLIQAGAVSTATNSYGLTVNAQTGATNNFSAAFLGGAVNIGSATTTTGYLLNMSTADTVGGSTTLYGQATNSASQFSWYIENNRGSFASYGGWLYGGSTNASSNLFGVNRQDKFFLFSDGASNLGMYTGTLGAASYSVGTNNLVRFNVNSSGRTFFGGTTSATAIVHLAAGTATASTAPLKFTPGTLNTTAEAGAMEYDGTNLFFTRAGTTRENMLVAVDNAAAPTTSIGVGIVNYYGSAATNFLGDPNRWLSVNVLGSVYKIPLYT